MADVFIGHVFVSSSLIVKDCDLYVKYPDYTALQGIASCSPTAVMSAFNGLNNKFVTSD